VAETINFTANAGKDIKNLKLKNYPNVATLKYCLEEQLPDKEEKNVAIYTTDSHRLFHGNGPNYPLSPITNNITVVKDIIFVMYNLQTGAVDPEITFPYVGKIQSIHITPSSSTPLKKRLIMDLEIKRGGSWSQLRRLYMNTGDTELLDSNTDFIINNEMLRFRIVEAQEDLDHLVSILKISV
jgi:hypothetical protein